jgi:hypothetical protein
MAKGRAREIEQLLLSKFDYYLEKSDPDIVILRRQDGSFVAAFSAGEAGGRASWRPPRRTTGG